STGMSSVVSAASADPNLLAHELVAIVGEEYVRRIDPGQLDINGVEPAVAVCPSWPEEVATILKLANARDLVVAPAGGLTKQQIGGVPERVDILLSTTRMNKIEEYDSGDLTIAVGAGMPFAEMQRKLGEHHQWAPWAAT